MKILFVALLSVVASTQARLIHDPSTPSAASEAQIKFAIENKYDQTGPGAKEPDYAYKTFKTLDEALVAYINDPDTKLPEHEKYRAYHQLLNKQPEGFGSQKPPLLVTRYKFPDKNALYHDPASQVGVFDLRGVSEFPYKTKVASEAYTLKKVHLPKFTSPNLSPFRTRHEEVEEKFNPNPRYTYSYGVHDRKTGDSKSAHESRDGGTVKGYYTVIDADGKQRTVHYTADDKQGFRAVVHRTPTNSHVL